MHDIIAIIGSDSIEDFDVLADFDETDEFVHVPFPYLQ